MSPDRTPISAGRIAGALLAVAVIGGIGWLDYATGADFGFSLFYLVPIVAAGMWLGRAIAVVAAIAAAAAWFAADLALVGPAGEWVSVWNGFTRLVIFVFVGVVTAVLRSDRQRLRQLLLESETTARTDALTGLPNLRAFLATLGEELARAQRDPRPLSMVYLDLDGFKQVNDRHGHAAGNELLERIGATIRREVRAGDTPARMGGDEFAVLLWNTDAEAGGKIAERIVSRIVEMRADFPDTELGASAGVVCFRTPPDDGETVLHAADAAMYEAKSQGKGRVVVQSAPS